LVPFAVAAYVFEARAGADRHRYVTRNFFNDVIYTLFYRGGFYSVFVMAALTNALEPRIAFLKLDLMAGAPWPLTLAAYWILGDFFIYWWHRLQHRSRFLWAFHTVHHSQEKLNIFTAYRRHPFETMLADLVIFFVLTYLILGIPTRGWLPLQVTMIALIALQHCELDWRFGPLYRWVVSPAFHAVHHSTDPRHYNRNFGAMFSIWDYLFGTAVADEPRPRRFGVEGLDQAESITDQLLAPLRYLRRGYTVPPVPAPTPEPRSPVPQP
jgi:sterol desaturase/sphingolipid hydroxylase (fatty acid hydroxylase superfamily)